MRHKNLPVDLQTIVHSTVHNKSSITFNRIGELFLNFYTFKKLKNRNCKSLNINILQLIRVQHFKNKNPLNCKNWNPNQIKHTP